MTLAILATIFGCVFLAWGANKFVEGSIAIAHNQKIPTLIVGIVLMGFATSFPEMLVSAIAAWSGSPTMGMGNAIGSNIANLSLVLGITAVVRPLILQSALLKREFPILIAAMLFAWILLSFGQLNVYSGLALLIAMAIVIVLMIFLTRKIEAKRDVIVAEIEEEISIPLSTPKALLWLLLGLIVLLISSRMLIYGATEIARYFGISELVIGLTVVAVGTSLPEVAASIVSVLKNESDLALGNLFGSNIFNTLIVLAMPGLIHPSKVPESLLTFDFPIMFGFTLLVMFFGYGYKKNPNISRVEGAVLILGYVGYLAYLY